MYHRWRCEVAVLREEREILNQKIVESRGEFAGIVEHQMMIGPDNLAALPVGKQGRQSFGMLPRH